jgi:uncharacterized protein
MRHSFPAKLLRIHVSEGDRFQDVPLHEAIVERCREMKIAGATVLRGVEGFGESAELHRPHLGRRDAPTTIVIVDTAENVSRLIPVVEQMLDTGMMATSDVEVVRVQKEPAT